MEASSHMERGRNKEVNSYLEIARMLFVPTGLYDSEEVFSIFQ